MENKLYKTKDLGEASALIAKQQYLIDIERQGTVCWFVFQNMELCKKLSYLYYFGDLQINARTFYEAMTRLKSRIFNR